MSAGSGQFQPRRATTEPLWLRAVLLTLALGFLALFLLLPLVIVFGEAFSKGAQVYLAAITEPAAAHAIKLTLIAAVIAVPCNAIFGLAASWAIAKFQFRGLQLARGFFQCASVRTIPGDRVVQISQLAEVRPKGDFDFM